MEFLEGFGLGMLTALDGLECCGSRHNTLLNFCSILSEAIGTRQSSAHLTFYQERSNCK
jgi:hypothetical protein